MMATTTPVANYAPLRVPMATPLGVLVRRHPTRRVPNVALALGTTMTIIIRLV